jgi:hypothetical protein
MCQQMATAHESGANFTSHRDHAEKHRTRGYDWRRIDYDNNVCAKFGNGTS